MDLKLLVFVMGVALTAAGVAGLPDDDLALDFNYGNQSLSKTRQTSGSDNDVESSITAATIQTPSYPNRYPKRSQLEWQFTVTGGFQLTCPVFNLRPRNRRGICRDYLHMEYGIFGRTKTYCADELNGATLTYTTNQLVYNTKLTFKSSKAPNKHFIGFNCTISPYIEQPTQECHCGVSTPLADRNNKIVGGKPARENQFPWQAQILYVFSNTFEKHCGGSIINNQYILTAAHCIYESSNERYTADDFVVILGERCFSNRPPWKLRYDVVEIIEHADYNYTTDNNDIALLKLGRTIDFANSQFRPICLPVTPTDPIPDQDDVEAVISGFGSIDSAPGPDRALPDPDCLQYAIVPTMNNTHCEKFYPPGKITENMICAGYPGVGEIDSCQGDSGGPMATNATSPSGNYYVQIGVVSWGWGCADQRYPGVYARVTEYIDWIHKHTEGSSTCSPP